MEINEVIEAANKAQTNEEFLNQERELTKKIANVIGGDTREVLLHAEEIKQIVRNVRRRIVVRSDRRLTVPLRGLFVVAASSGQNHEAQSKEREGANAPNSRSEAGGSIAS